MEKQTERDRKEETMEKERGRQRQREWRKKEGEGYLVPGCAGAPYPGCPYGG